MDKQAQLSACSTCIHSWQHSVQMTGSRACFVDLTVGFFFSSFFSFLLWSSLQCTLSDLDKGYLHRACLWHLKGPCVLTATLYNQQIYYFLQSKALHIICKSAEAIKTDLHSTWIVSSVWNCNGYLGWKCIFLCTWACFPPVCAISSNTAIFQCVLMHVTLLSFFFFPKQASIRRVKAKKKKNIHLCGNIGALSILTGTSKHTARYCTIRIHGWDEGKILQIYLFSAEICN